MNHVARLLRRVDPMIATVIIVLIVLLRLIGIVMGPPDGLNYRFEGPDSILEYGEDGVAWLWLRNSELSGRLSLPEGKWTASTVLPPCADGSVITASMRVADMALSGSIGLGQRLWSAPISFGQESLLLEVESTQEPCTLVGDGRKVSVGVFFEPLAGSVQTPEIASSIPAESSPDGRSWVWSTEPTLSGAIRLGPRVGSWAVDVTVPGCDSGPASTPVEVVVSVGTTSVSEFLNTNETATLYLRPTFTQSFPFTVVLTNSTACPLPSDGRAVHFFVGVRAVDPDAV